MQQGRGKVPAKCLGAVKQEKEKKVYNTLKRITYKIQKLTLHPV
jgi:hypothetical protein